MLRIGITMRSSAATHYPEARDALARDWHHFMAQALPEVAWLPVPNLGRAVAGWTANWALDGVILSGGEDRGEDPQRDDTEDALWTLCQTGPLRLDVGRPGHSKASGLSHWLAGRGIGPDQVVAFGDNHNDVSMLQAVGHGVAMAGAPAAVQASADEVCGSNDEPPIAAVLQRLQAEGLLG